MRFAEQLRVHAQYSSAPIWKSARVYVASELGIGIPQQHAIASERILGESRLDIASDGIIVSATNRKS